MIEWHKIIDGDMSVFDYHLVSQEYLCFNKSLESMYICSLHDGEFRDHDLYLMDGITHWAFKPEDPKD